jgi:hypothetical protein
VAHQIGRGDCLPSRSVARRLDLNRHGGSVNHCLQSRRRGGTIIASNCTTRTQITDLTCAFPTPAPSSRHYVRGFH